jgi:sigma54-dependent transcription regulator
VAGCRIFAECRAVLRVVVEHVREDGVGGYMDSDDNLLGASVAALVAFRFSYEQTDFVEKVCRQLGRLSGSGRQFLRGRKKCN